MDSFSSELDSSDRIGFGPTIRHLTAVRRIIGSPGSPEVLAGPVLLNPIAASDVGQYVPGSTPTPGGNSVLMDSWVYRGLGLFWFSRMHITPSFLDLGNVVGDQTYVVSVWNAFTEPKTLNGVNTVGLDGAELADGPSSGVMRPYEEFKYNLNVFTDGPPAIDIQLTWEYEEAGVIDPLLTAYGRRLLLWPFMPQWPVDETFSWKSEVIRTYNKVTRASLMNVPRKQLTASFQLNDAQQREAQRLLRTWGYRPFGVPDFTQHQEIGAVASGAVTVALDTSVMDVAAGDLGVIWEDWDKTEIVQIDAVTTDSITLRKPTARSFSNACFSPMFSGSLRAGMTLNQDNSGWAIAKGSFYQDLCNDLREAETLVHHGHPLIPFRPEQRGQVPEGTKWNVTIIDSGVGLARTMAEEESPVYTSSVLHTAQGLSELMALKKWLHNRSGRVKAFCLPTYQNDFTLGGTATNGSNAITLATEAYGQQWAKGALQIEMKDGTVLDLTVTSTSVASGQTGVSVEQTLPFDIYEADVARISLVRKVVLASDTVRIKHDVDGKVLQVRVEEVPW